MDPECDFVTLLGQAGTGKTLLALAAGLAQVLETKLYSEIIVTRVTVCAGDAARGLVAGALSAILARTGAGAGAASVLRATGSIRVSDLTILSLSAFG